MSKSTAKGTKKSCRCDECRSACEYKPGWFLPGEAERVASHLGVSVKELFRTRLAVDWWVGNGKGDTFLLSPAVVTSPPGQEFPGNPKGECVFYKKGLCEIHPVKPYECREAIHGQSPISNGRHQKVAERWKKHQRQIQQLLGREPKSESFSLLDWLSTF